LETLAQNVGQDSRVTYGSFQAGVTGIIVNLTFAVPEAFPESVGLKFFAHIAGWRK
jgi:hypothetical protein